MVESLACNLVKVGRGNVCLRLELNLNFEPQS